MSRECRMNKASKRERVEGCSDVTTLQAFSFTFMTGAPTSSWLNRCVNIHTIAGRKRHRRNVIIFLNEPSFLWMANDFAFTWKKAEQMSEKRLKILHFSWVFEFWKKKFWNGNFQFHFNFQDLNILVSFLYHEVFAMAMQLHFHS